MELDAQLVRGWPKLAWVAVWPPGAGKMTVYHGPYVEVHAQWCAEAVWVGGFAAGDFDRTDLVFGTGIRCRGDEVTFVTSGSTLDRLCYCHSAGAWHVANSLPALLAVTGLALRDDYGDYIKDIDTLVDGLAVYKRSLPADGGDVCLVHFNNLVYDGKSLREVEKADSAPRFETFQVYHGYLLETAKRLAANMNDPARKHKVRPLVTVSTGYDASMAAVIARHAGCREAVTITRATSLWRGSDSGEEISRHLALSCRTYGRTAERYPLEETMWSVAGSPSILNWTLFDYPEPLCLFFTGCYGDRVWSRRDRDYRDAFEGIGLAHGGMGEFRLFKGVFHCPLPFWGMRHFRELKAISFSDEMAPWALYTDYDRPICRRIVEEAGVPRSLFGTRKKNTSHNAAFLWPYSPESRVRFRAFLESRGVAAPSEASVWLRRQVAWAESLLYHNVALKLGLRKASLRRWITSRANDLLFHWANDELRKMYAEALKSAAGEMPTRKGRMGSGPEGPPR